MAGAPDDEQGPRTHGTTRVRRLAWGGAGALGLALATSIVLVGWGLSWLAGRASHESAPPPKIAAAPPVAVASLANADELPPSVRRYLENTVYPPGSGALSEAQGDLLRPNRRFEDYRPIPDTFSTDANQIVTVRLTCDHYYYEGDDPIELTLEVLRGNTPVEPLALDAGTTREGRAGLEGNRTTLRFLPARDVYTATLDPARFADHHGPVIVDARIEYAPGAVHEETLRLFLTPEGKIPARFTGEIEDDLVNGSLQIEIGVEVEQPGRYRIDANLYDRFGAPLAFSAFKGDLARGDRAVEIEFFGRLLLDLGARGPFSVGEIRGYRFLDGDYPDRERMADLPGRFRTDDYSPTAFSSDEFMDPHKARMLDLLMEDVARGIAIDAPPIPTPGATDFDIDPEGRDEDPTASDAPNAPSTPASASRGRT